MRIPVTMIPHLSFKKDERLFGKKSIDRIFREGESFFVYPFKVYWLLTPAGSKYPAQVLIGAGKRAFKRAVDRNKVKRQIREIYRLHKTSWYEFLGERNQNCAIALIYTPNVQIEYQDMEKKIKLIFRRLYDEIDNVLNNKTRSLSEK